MNKQRAVYLMLFPDKCWHEWTPLKAVSEDRSGHGDYSCQCINCGMVLGPCSHGMLLKKRKSNPDLTTWPGFGLMYDRAEECEWWDEFIFKLSITGTSKISKGIVWGYFHLANLINPTRFLNALYEFGVTSERIKEAPDEASRS